jgi:hypothetical protein
MDKHVPEFAWSNSKLETQRSRAMVLLIRRKSVADVAEPFRAVAAAITKIEAGSLFERTSDKSRRLRFPEYGIVYVKFLYLYLSMSYEIISSASVESAQRSGRHRHAVTIAAIPRRPEA